MYDIFLSYSTKDRDRLQPLFSALEERGWSVFWDHRTIDIGDHWSKKINHAIRTSKCVVVVWSENSIESEWVLEEANIGKQRDVFLPIRIDDVIFPVGFTMRQAGDFVDWKGDVNDQQFIRLAEKVQELVERYNAEQARFEAAVAAEQERLAKEKAAADQKAREAAERQRSLEEYQARLAAEEAAKQKKLEQQRLAEQKAREEAERQAKAQQEQIKREQAAAEEKARKEAARQAKLNQGDKKFPLIPALFLSTAVLGGSGYYVYSKENLSVEAIESEMVDIPAGTFTMGCVVGRDDVVGGCFNNEKPAHQVTLVAFKMAETETTFDQWDACEKANVCPHAEDVGWGRGNRPVINVSWDDITQKYIPWLNRKTGKAYRLPTEAEWEYAARGGADTAFPWGNAIGKGKANCTNSSCGDTFDFTAPVGSFAANGYGLHDMNGNVWEWCQDWYASDYYASSPASNPKGAASGTARVLRDGAWGNIAQGVRSAYRGGNAPGFRGNGIGFRLVLP